MTGQVIVNNPPAAGSPPISPSKQVRALLVSIALGVVWTSLHLFGGRPGLNVVLAAGALALGLRLVLGPLSSTGRLLLAAGLVPALGLVLWDAEVLRAFNVLALLGCVGLFLLFGVEPPGEGATGESPPGGDRPWTLGRATIVQGVVGLTVAAYYGLTGGPLLWSAAARQMDGRPSARRWRPIAGAAIRGLLMAVPLIILFTMLFTRADPAFRRLLEGLLDWAGWLPSVGKWLARFVFWAWLASGVLYTALRNPVPALVSPLKVPLPALHGLEPVVALGALNALFLAFVLMQIRYLLGGVRWLEAAGLTYAEYARRGFFELLAVTALVIPTLRIAQGLMPHGGQGTAHRLFRWMAWLMLALTGLMMVSAGHRLALYVGAYGWTIARLYAAIIMGGIALILLLLFSTTLGREERGFAAGILAVAFLVLMTLNLINPVAVVMRHHAGRIQAGKQADSYYMSMAGAASGEGVPALLAALPSLPGEQRGSIASQLLSWWGIEDPEAGFLHWNFSHARARRLVGEQRDQLRQWEQEVER